MAQQSELVSTGGGIIAQGGTLTTDSEYAGVTNESKVLELNQGGTIVSETTLSPVAQADVSAGNAEIAFLDGNHFEIGLEIGPQELVEVHGPAATGKEDLDHTI